jgi:hypothetical protein
MCLGFSIFKLEIITSLPLGLFEAHGLSLLQQLEEVWPPMHTQEAVAAAGFAWMGAFHLWPFFLLALGSISSHKPPDFTFLHKPASLSDC